MRRDVARDAPRLDGLLLVSLAVAAGALAWSAPFAVGIACAAVLLGCALGGRVVIAVVAALGFAIGAWRASHAITSFQWRAAAPERCSFEGTVARSPVWAGDGVRVDIDVARSTCARGRIALHASRDVMLARGDRVEGIAQLSAPYRFWNDGDPRPILARRAVTATGGAQDLRVIERGFGVESAIDRARDRIRKRILASYPDSSASMARALVLGEDDLPDGDQRAFRMSGLSHLLAVSGMHLVIVVAGIVTLIRALLVRIPSLAVRVDPMRVAAAMGIPIAWIYADLAGGSGSAVRAAWMAGAALLARVLVRRPDLPRALALSILGMWIFDPLVPFDLSFALSAAATGGLMALARPVEERLKPLPGFISKPIAATVAATIACTPILATMSNGVPIAGVLANVVAVPVGEAAALPLCLGHVLLSAIPLAERGTAVAAGGALDLVRGIARIAATAPQISVPSPTAAQLVAMGVFAAASLGPFVRTFRLASAALFAICEILAREPGRGELRITYLDVGQGDAALVELPDGKTMLIDGGGLVGSPVDVGERVIGPFLGARRIRSIDVVALSHPHPDHYGGLGRGLAGVRVGAFWDTGQGENEHVGGPYTSLLADLRARGTAIERPDRLCGLHAMGEVTIEVLAPCPEPNGDRGPNDNSLVLRIRYRARSFLFVGDAERLEEGDLVRRGDLRADVLKVGHHGSRTSTSPAFLSAVDPSIAVISCGVRNRFGHPHPNTMRTLARIPTVYRTDLDGAVTLVTDGDQVRSTTPM